MYREGNENAGGAGEAGKAGDAGDAGDAGGGAGEAGDRVGDSGDYPSGFLSASRLWEAGRDQGGDQDGDHGGDHGKPASGDEAASPLPPAGTAARARHAAAGIGWRAAQRAQLARSFAGWAAECVWHRHEVQRRYLEP